MFGLNLLRITFQVTSKLRPNKPKQVRFRNWSIVRGDKVKVRTGDDKGKVARIIRVFRRTNQVVVNGVNKKSKHFSNQIHLCRK